MAPEQLQFLPKYTNEGKQAQIHPAEKTRCIRPAGSADRLEQIERGSHEGADHFGSVLIGIQAVWVMPIAKDAFTFFGRMTRPLGYIMVLYWGSYMPY